MSKIAPVVPYTKAWEKSANELARSYVRINACVDCGRPVVSGYCCSVCGSGQSRSDS
jgi:hypothetical protein